MINAKKDAIIARLHEELCDEYSIEINTTTKNNSTKLTGVQIKKIGEHVAPVFYIEDAPVDVIVENIIKRYRAQEDELRRMQSISAEMSEVMKDKDKFLEKVIPVAVNGTRNAGMLENVPHEILFGDIALTFRLNWIQYGVQVDNDCLDRVNVTYDELREAAIKNTTPRVRSLFEIMTGVSTDEPHVPFYVLDRDVSDRDNAPFGAGTIVSPDAIKAVQDKLHTEQFILLPSSVHEWLVAPMNENFTGDILRTMVHDVNEECVDREEFLSNDVFIYNGERIEVFM